ncbi:MAG: peptidoglycan DD-metalloendopeptidase family protein [Candidatus Omnitrophica bacterium]|nr:peptidoglycan DD-metalloendopeptidase family protein [Candidatus Omnitrophota bacterium]
MMKNDLKYITVAITLLFLAGCAGASYVTVPTPPREAGLYHKVRKGETLWRISKQYGVGLETIAAANRLPNKQKIYVGQLLFIPEQERLSYANIAKETSFIWPIKGKILSFCGSYKDGVKNKGIDIKARHGEAVVASRSGKVTFVEENMKGFGKTIIINHDEKYSTVYAYNSQLLVKVGQVVKQGTVIAKAGQSGRAATPRLHFEIRKKHEPQNPFYFLP